MGGIGRILPLIQGRVRAIESCIGRCTNRIAAREFKVTQPSPTIITPLLPAFLLSSESAGWRRQNWEVYGAASALGLLDVAIVRCRRTSFPRSIPARSSKISRPRLFHDERGQAHRPIVPAVKCELVANTQSFTFKRSNSSPHAFLCPPRNFFHLMDWYFHPSDQPRAATRRAAGAQPAAAGQRPPGLQALIRCRSPVR